MSMNQSYGDEFKKICEGLSRLCGDGFLPFAVGLLLGAAAIGVFDSAISRDKGKEAGRQELLQEFNKTGWYYDEMAKEFWRKESTCQ